MLRHILLDLQLFADEASREESQKGVLWFLEALTQWNQRYLRMHPNTPLIYKSGIKYLVPEQFERQHLPEVDEVRQFLIKKGADGNVMAAFESITDMCGAGEHFRDIPRIIENGGGDCDNVACWRAAELRELGVNACPYITWRKRPDGGMTYHVITRWPDGSSEDPSLLLGMSQPARTLDRQEEERKLGERAAEVINGNMAKIAPDTHVIGHGGGHGGGHGHARSGELFDEESDIFEEIFGKSGARKIRRAVKRAQ